MKNKIILILVALFTAVTLFSGIKGYIGNPTIIELNTKKWKERGPFELSPERGRFALLYSIVEDHSYIFSLPVARFATPDLGIKNNNYVSLFAPGVSFLLIPGYLIGEILGASQVGAFSIISTFALVNFFLIISISRKIGADSISSALSAFVFLFATPAFSYATTIYQHHISVFLILLSIRVLLVQEVGFWRSFSLWLILFASIPIDYPNLILSFPIVLTLLLSYINKVKMAKKIKLQINWFKFLSIIGAAIPLLMIMNFNMRSYGKYFQFASTVGGVQEIDKNGLPTVPETANKEDSEKFLRPEERQRSATNFFKSRHQLPSTNILLFSKDRGVFIFTPVILLGFIGAFFIKNKVGQISASLLLSIILFNVVLYSMRSDAWGGWAFGSRYLIPAYATLSILLSLALTNLKGKWYFVILFWILCTYSIGVNTLGALTTNAIPPKPEAQQLEIQTNRYERFSYDRNWEYLNNQGTKSFAYQTWGYKYITPLQYFYIISGSIAVVATLLTIGVVVSKNNDKN